MTRLTVFVICSNAFRGGKIGRGVGRLEECQSITSGNSIKAGLNNMLITNKQLFIISQFQITEDAMDKGRRRKTFGNK